MKLIAKKYKYLAVFSVILIAFIGFYIGGNWSFFLPVYAFLFIPFVELFTNGNSENLSKMSESIFKKSRFFDAVIYSIVPIQWMLLFYYLYTVSYVSTSNYELFGMTVSMGISCGVLGINVAHELGHRSTKHEQFMSKVLLLSSFYMHFFIEHNRGHHSKVATMEDPASSRRNEIVYFFWIRSIVNGYLSAWKLEKFRLQKMSKSIFSLNNEMLIFQLIQLLLLLIIYFIFSLKAVLLFLSVAALGILLLETVNYIEHYGLRRKHDGQTYKKVMPVHSWNSNHPIGRILLFELSRHSDHHYKSNRKYQILRSFDNSPQMPTGYPGMILLSLIPPLWFLVMNKQLDLLKSKEMELLD